MSGQETMDFFAPMSAEEEKAKIKAMRDGEPMAREGMYWSEEEDEAVLFKFYEKYVSTTKIAVQHERKESAIIQRIGVLDAQRYGKQKRPNRKKNIADPPGCLCKHCTVDRAFCPRCIHYQGNKEEA